MIAGRKGSIAIAAAAVAAVIAFARPVPYRPAASAWAGQTAIVTGANTGVGYETARRLALGGFRVVVACRSESKAARAADRINTEIGLGDGGSGGGGGGGVAVPAVLNLASRASIRAFAAGFEASGRGRLDVLVCNAGIAGAGSQLLTTEDGCVGPITFPHVLRTHNCRPPCHHRKPAGAAPPPAPPPQPPHHPPTYPHPRLLAGPARLPSPSLSPGVSP